MAAEELGYDSLWAGERVLFPESPADGMYGIPGLPWADHYRSNADPLVALTLAASVTRRVQLGTNVLVAPFHQPFQLARALGRGGGTGPRAADQRHPYPAVPGKSGADGP